VGCGEGRATQLQQANTDKKKKYSIQKNHIEMDIIKIDSIQMGFLIGGEQVPTCTETEGGYTPSGGGMRYSSDKKDLMYEDDGSIMRDANGDPMYTTTYCPDDTGCGCPKPPSSTN
jgi:hypothetical protein